MSFVVDFLATCSVVGIWPRFIEPRLLKTTELCWELDARSRHLEGLTLLHLTDLHFHESSSPAFLDKILCRVARLKPDVILFSGDFICYSQLEAKERLQAFLNRLEAPFGSFCSLGNHDYAAYVSRSPQGVYDLMKPPNPLAGLLRGMKMLVQSPPSTHTLSSHVYTVGLHEELCSLLRRTPFQLLENTTVTLPNGLNITGLGDLALGRCRPETAFAGYDATLPGVVLSHNPDTFPLLQGYPGEWIFSGHSHGEQIHLPWPKWGRAFSRRLAGLEHPYTRGLFEEGGKKLYVNRGLGGHKPFRLCSPPEITVVRGVYKR